MTQEIKPELSLCDPAFSTESAPQSLLAAEISASKFTCAVYDPGRGKFVALESYSFSKIQLAEQLNEHLIDIIGSSAILRSPFQKTRIIWCGTQYTLLPVELYDNKHDAAYLQFTQSLPAGSSVFSDTLKNLHAANIYAVPSAIKETLAMKFKMHQLTHHVSVMAELLLIENKQSVPEHTAYINVGQNVYDLVILSKGRLAFCNTFEYRSAEDFIYFLLFAFEQLQLDAGKTPVTLMGDILPASAIYGLLMKYVREVSFISRSRTCEYSYVFNDLPSHFHHNLLNALVCE